MAGTLLSFGSAADPVADQGRAQGRHGPETVRYGAARFNRVGSICPFSQVLSVYQSAGVTTLEELADVERHKAAIDSRTGAEVQAAVKRTLATPDDIVKKILAAAE